MVEGFHGDDRKEGDGPGSPKPHHRILSIDVSGGFLNGTRLDFADGLNCIIGGRGTGKTTVMEFIRYVLDLMPDPADSRPRTKAMEGIVRSNLGSGMISLEVETKHGTRYRAEKPWDDSAQVLDGAGDPVAVSLDRDLVFKADIYSQNEIEEIATNPRFQLSLIDKFEEETVRSASQEIQKAKRSIETSALDLRNLDHRIQEIDDVVPELEVVKTRLEELQVIEGPEADLINTAHEHKALRARETEAVEDLRRVVTSVGGEFKRYAEGVAEDCRNALGDGPPDSPNQALFEELGEATAEFVAVFQDAIPDIRRRCDTLLATLTDISSRLAHDHARQEQQYREIIARSAKEKEHAAERARLQQRHLELVKARNEQETLNQKRKALETTHRTLTAKLSTLRDERFAVRKKVAERLSVALAPAIRVSITQAGSPVTAINLSRRSRDRECSTTGLPRASSKTWRRRSCPNSSGGATSTAWWNAPASRRTRPRR